MITSHHQNVVQNENIIIGNLTFENVEKFKYLGVTLMIKIREEIRLIINKGNTRFIYSLEKFCPPAC